MTSIRDASNIRAAVARWNTPSAYLVLVVAGFFFWPAFRDAHIRQEPWIMAEVEVRDMGTTPPLIFYHATAPYYVRADWTAWVQMGDRRACLGHGAAAYGPNTEPLLWDWDAFFERTCNEPAEPYQVCVRFDARFPSGVASEAGPYCSPVHDPREAAGS